MVDAAIAFNAIKPRARYVGALRHGVMIVAALRRRILAEK